MTLLELDGCFLTIQEDGKYDMHRDIRRADGVMFLCPKCYKEKGRKGCHSVICWQPHVHKSHTPTPGRWQLSGTRIGDVSLAGGSVSVLTPSCGAHFYVREGQVEFC